MSKRKASHKVDFEQLQPGERLSRCTYYKVQKVDREREVLVVENQEGLAFEVTRRIPEQEMFSASQVKETVKVNRTELVDILMHAGNTIFTVEFEKQLREADVADRLRENLDQLSAWTPAQLKKFCKQQLLRGEARQMTGYLIAAEPTLGRSKVMDLEIQEERLVDPPHFEELDSCRCSLRGEIKNISSNFFHCFTTPSGSKRNMAALTVEMIRYDSENQHLRTDTRDYGEAPPDAPRTIIGKLTLPLPNGHVDYYAHAVADVEMRLVGGVTVFRHQGKCLTALNIALVRQSVTQ